MNTALRSVAIWIGIRLVWEAAFRVFQWRAWIFPAPSHVFESLLSLRIPLASANVVSLLRLLVGFGISMILGGVMGMLMWRWRALDDAFGPLFLGFQTLPSVCWVPLAVLLFGLNETGILFVLVMGSFFAIALALRDGLRTIPPLYSAAGQMLGARGWK